MAWSKNIVLGLFAIVAMAGLTQASTRSLPPPLFRETPNARFVPIQPMDDEILDYRLPNNTVPVHYDVTLTTNVHTGDKNFNGVVKIDIYVEVETNEIVLHQRQLTIVSASIIDRNAANPVSQVLVSSYEADREFLTLKRSDSANFAYNSNWTLTIEYTGLLREDNGGFYLSTYTDENNNIRNLATTQFESTDARHGFPCYDEPAKRATFTITINHSPTYNAISNMPVETMTDVNGIRTTKFERSINMPTYLVAYIVSDFEYTEGVLNGLKQRIYSRPGTTHEQEWALVSGMLIIQRLAEYYDIKFPIAKLDQVAVPDFAAGAMENWGLVTYREEYMLYNTESSTISTKTNIANIIAHEYTHQWFGNLVAIDHWTYLWMKEGFATLFSYVSTDEAYPNWGIYQQFHTDDYQRALNADAGSYSRPMTSYVQKPNEISSTYDGISYSKAGSVLHMFQHALTDAVFKGGLRNYLKNNAYSSAKEEKLFIAIQTAATEQNYELKAQIEPMMKSWTNQGGYPLLTVKRNYENGNFTVTQTQFFNDETLSSDKLWYVPFNFAEEGNPDFRNTEAQYYLLNEAEIEVKGSLSDDKWLILNKQSTGYYRIQYDEENWKLITAGLQEKPHKIHPRNRAQLLNDAYRFATSNRLSHEILMNLMTYLTAEDQYAPWSTANTIIVAFNRYLTGDKDYELFRAFVSEIAGNIYDKLGVNDIPGEQHYQPYIRSIAINLACLAGDTSCLEATNNKLNDLVKNNIPIEPNLQTQTYCNGLRSTSDEIYNFVFNKLMNSNDQAERRILISSLGCSQTESQVTRFIESSINMENQLRTQERYTILSPVYSRGEVGLLACIKFLDSHWEAYSNLNAGFGGANPLPSDIVGMSQYVTNADQETKLMDLITKIGDGLTANVKTSAEANIAANYAWLKTNRDPIMSWVQNYFSRSGSATTNASFVSIAMALVLAVSRLF